MKAFVSIIFAKNCDKLLIACTNFPNPCFDDLLKYKTKYVTNIF